MIEFITTLYNEEAEIDDLIAHISPYVDRINIVDDGSTDSTADKLDLYFIHSGLDFHYKTIEHTGLCEIGRIKALEMCQEDSWVVMLDADERFANLVDLENILTFCRNNSSNITHIYFSQHEFIDGQKVAEFAKVKIFKKSAAHLPEIIHKDPQFDGDPINLGGIVIHRKTSTKQVMRELQYLDTYDKLLDEGKVTQSDVNWFKGMHHFVKERHG